LGKLLVVEPDIAEQRRFQFFAGSKLVALQHLFDPVVEPFHHAVGLG
jgi:hypothetical protein